ncbi:MAG: DUF1679 domain-containing protein [Gammaproteobacteria bacterium]|mgnify:FL=1|nr:DUF1679 domain-containing protein [Gammaproteobacteria bacterium]MBT4618592.1 DUF1679 domain-containing protein [Gammaproteobacteria bacterium]
MTTEQHLLLVRHGETQGNREQIAHGQTESPLNEHGIKQAQTTAEMLQGWERSYDKIYCSPLSRAHDTARAISNALGLPISVHSGLMESNLGDLEGATYKELHEFGYAKHSIQDDDFTGHNGESPRAVADRIERSLLEIRALHPGENLIIVSHGGTIAHLIARLTGSKPAFGPQFIMHNAAITEIILPEDSAPEIIVLNHHEHLPEELKIDPTQGNSNNKRLPLTVDDLTLEWLQEAMAPHLKGATFTAFEPKIIGVGEGFMGQLARVTLSYNEKAADAPTSLVAKFASTKQETRDMAADQKLYQREIGFYKDIGNKVGVPIAECYYSTYIEESNHFILLLEDLAPGEPSDQVIGTDKETSREVIEQFARLHAKWWNNPELEQYDWAKWILTEMPMEQGLGLLKQSMTEVEETGKFDAYPELKRLMPLLGPLFKFEPAPPYPFSLTHGDLRSDNIIKPSAGGGRFAIIDWQLSGVGDPVNDIVRWMVQSISIEDRRETEQELLGLYYERLVEYGVKGYSYKKFINAYRTNLVVVQLMFSMSMDSVDQSSERAQALFHQFYARLDAALVDWEIEKTLKLLPMIYPFIKIMLIVQKAFRQKK